MSRRLSAIHKPPILGYHVMASRAAVAVPWYLAGGVSAANCIAAYQAIGADDYATSKVNLANSGTYDLTESNGAVSWDAGTGWGFVFDEENSKVLLTGIAPNTPLTLIIRFSGVESEAFISGISVDETIIIGFLTDGSTTIVLTCGGDNINVYEEVQSGVMCTSNITAYIDGTNKGDYFDGTMSGNELILPIGGLNADGFYVSFNVSVQAVGIYDVAISDAQVSAISTAMAALDGGAKSQSLEGMLSFEPEEEKLWWQGADVDVLAQAQPQVELTWWDKANRVVNAALAKAKKFINDKLYQLWQAIEDYFTYDEEE